MLALLRNAAGFIDANLGLCPRRMRTSFIVAFGAWTAVAIVWLAGGETIGVRLAAVVAFAFSGLWIAHLLAYGSRALKGSVNVGGRSGAASALSRRQLASVFVRKVGTAALGTALPAAAFVLLVGTPGSAKCDEFGCNGNLCDSSNPCNRGCKCVYPEPGKMGYCVPWYQQ